MIKRTPAKVPVCYGNMNFLQHADNTEYPGFPCDACLIKNYCLTDTKILRDSIDRIYTKGF